MIRNAREALKESGYDAALIERLHADFGGQMLSFPKGPRRAAHDLTPFLLAYAREKDWQTGLPVSDRTFFRVLKRLRADNGPETAPRYQQLGLSLRDLARLLDASVPTVQQRLRGTAKGLIGDSCGENRRGPVL
jgi:hypothetical protein